MRIKLLNLILFLSAFFTTEEVQSQPQKIFLNPKAQGSERQTRFVDSLFFTPLEIVGGVEPGAFSNIIVTKDYFLINDYSRKSFLIYSKNGHYIKEINYKKTGNLSPGYDEQNNLLIFFGNNKNYTLTQKDEIKIAMDWENPHNKKYFKKYIIDLNDSTFAIKKGTPLKSDILHAYPFYDDYYWQGQIVTNPLFKDSLDYEIKIYKDDELVHAYFPYNRVSEPKFLYTKENVNFFRTDTSYINLFSRPYCDTIYKMVYDSLFPAYQLVLPMENSLPATFFTKPFKNKTERDNFNRNNGWVMRQILGVYETPRFIYFGVRYHTNFESYIYLKESRTTYKTKNIKADGNQYNLQLLSDFRSLRRGDRFYRMQKAGDLISYFDKNKNAKVPEELEDFLSSNPPEGAPVIVSFKLKN